MEITTIVMVGGIAGIFVAIMLSLTAVGVFDNEARGVSKSLSVMEAYSAAPPELRRELDPSFNERVLTPLLDRALNVGKKLTPSDHGDRIRKKLEIAGNPPGWTIDRVTSLKFVGFAVALVLSLAVSLLFGFGFAPTLAVCVLAALAGYSGPNMYLYQKGYDRTKGIQKTMPTPSTSSRSRWSPASASTRPSPTWRATPGDPWPRSSSESSRRCRSVSAGARRCARSAIAPTCRS